MSAQMYRVNAPDVELSDSNIKPGCSKALQLRRDAADLANDQVSLRADAIDGDTARLEASNERDERVDFPTGTIEVVIVDVELRIGVCGASSLESDVDKGLAKEVVKHGGAEGTIIVENFIHDILRRKDILV